VLNANSSETVRATDFEFDVCVLFLFKSLSMHICPCFCAYVQMLSLLTAVKLTAESSLDEVFHLLNDRLPVVAPFVMSGYD